MGLPDPSARPESPVSTPESTGDEDRTDVRREAALGVVSGAFATSVMTVFRTPISRSPPPTARLWARLLGDGGPSEYVGRGLLLHLCYGAGAGGLFGALLGPRLTGSDAERERTATLAGTVYGVLLSGFGVVVLLDRLLGLDLDPHERFVFHVSHVVYGLALGTFFGAYD